MLFNSTVNAHILIKTINKLTERDMIHFDTHEFIQDLTNSGMDAKQASTLSNQLKAVFDGQRTELATKHDVEKVTLECRSEIALVNSEIALVKTELKGDIQTLKWMIGFLMAAVVASLIQHNFIH